MVAPFAPVSLMVPGGPEAARHARHVVLRRVGGHVSDAAADALAVVISELVTNSVVHGDVGPGRYLHVNVGVVDERLLVTVSDRGSRSLPRLTRGADGDGRGLGLQLVDLVAGSWGVARDGSGRTQVWCELGVSENGGGQLYPPAGPLHPPSPAANPPAPDAQPPFPGAPSLFLQPPLQHRP